MYIQGETLINLSYLILSYFTYTYGICKTNSILFKIKEIYSNYGTIIYTSTYILSYNYKPIWNIKTYVVTSSINQ